MDRIESNRIQKSENGTAFVAQLTAIVRFQHGKLREVVRRIYWPAINLALQNALLLHDSFTNLEIHEIEEVANVFEMRYV